MKRSFCLLFSLLFLVLPLTACQTEAEDVTGGILPPPRTDVALSPAGSDAATDFALRLFLSAAEDGKNTLISPLSVLTALSMTANGADGETRAQMEAVLGMPVNELNGWIAAYRQSLPEAKGYKLSMANSIWYRDDGLFTPKEAFLRDTVDYYGAGVYKAPFDSGTCRDINRWVKENTDGMIDNVLDGIPADAVMYLINALAFDAEWQDVYKETAVREGVFTREDGTVEKAELMYSGERRYMENDAFTGFLKYYKDQKYAFAALLPKEGLSLSAALSTLSGEEVTALLSGAKFATVRAAIPKFRTEYSREMSGVLSHMGMTDAFSPRLADFSLLGTSSGDRLFLSRVLHKTFIQVDEKGTKAGAVTVVEVMPTSAAPAEEPKVVFLDRPFLYMLIDTETSLPFFIGTVYTVE